jgi:hypothetical protein
MATWLIDLARRGVATRAVLLSVAVAGLGGCMAPIAMLWHGWTGLAAVGAAAAVCLAAALVALVLCHLFAGPEFALVSVLGGMTVRMGLPLAFALACQVRGGMLAEGGVVYYLLVLYPAILALETALVLSRPTRRPAGTSAPSAGAA